MEFVCIYCLPPQLSTHLPAITGIFLRTLPKPGVGSSVSIHFIELSEPQAFPIKPAAFFIPFVLRPYPPSVEKRETLYVLRKKHPFQKIFF